MDGEPRTTLVDVHSHFIPDFYRQALIAAGHSHPDGMPAIPAWSEADMLTTMDRLGIAHAFLSISSPGVHLGNDAAARKLAREVNREGHRLRFAHPERFGHFASLPMPDADGSLREIAFALDDLGADGFVLESNSGGVYPGDPAYEPVLAELNRRGAAVLLHPTSPACPCHTQVGPKLPAPILEFMFETTRAVANLVLSRSLTRHPNIRFIIPHAGATLPITVDRIAASLPKRSDHSDLLAGDVLAALGGLYYDLAGAPVPRLLTALRTFAKDDHLFYGSDWPFTPESVVGQLKAALEEFLRDDRALWEKVARSNASVLFPRLRSWNEPPRNP